MEVHVYMSEPVCIIHALPPRKQNVPYVEKRENDRTFNRILQRDVSVYGLWTTQLNRAGSDILLQTLLVEIKKSLYFRREFTLKP